MAFMIAMMCILLGLLAEMITRTFYESQGKAIYNIRSARNLQGIGATPETQADPKRAERSVQSQSVTETRFALPHVSKAFRFASS